MGDLSKHFSKAEFKCPCCNKVVVSSQLIEALEKMRTLIDKPIKVVSGYRCPAHNAGVGGTLNSRHVLGQAADIRIDGMDVWRIYALAEQIRTFQLGGIGVYPQQNFVHVDVRTQRARWGQWDGRYVSIAELLKIL